MLKFTPLLTLLLVVLAYTTTPATAQCDNPVVRRQWNTMSRGERAAYVAAAKSLAERPNCGCLDPSRMSFFDFVKNHDDYAYYTHSTPVFFPYHRALVYLWEQAIQSTGQYSGGVPYIDWATHATDWQDVMEESRSLLGGSGTPENGYCVTDGEFGVGRFAISAPRQVGDCPAGAPQSCRTCLKRFSMPGSFMTEPNILPFLTQTTFEGFDNNGKNGDGNYFHASPHLLIGGYNDRGNLGDMANGNVSPNDIYFWFHHSYVDKVWYRWQNVCPAYKTLYGGVSRDGREAQLTDQIDGMPFFVSQILDTVSGNPLCYTYDTAPADTRIPTPAGGCPNVNIVVPTPTATATVAPVPTAAGETEFWFQDVLSNLVPVADIRLGSSRRLQVVARRQELALNETITGEPTATAAPSVTENLVGPTSTTTTTSTASPTPKINYPGYNICSNGTLTVNVLTGDSVTVPENYKPIGFGPYRILAIPCSESSVKKAYFNRATKLWLIPDSAMDPTTVPEYVTPKGLKPPTPGNPNELQYPTCIDPNSPWAQMMGLVPTLLKESCNRLKRQVDECNNDPECRKKHVLEVRAKLAKERDGTYMMDSDSDLVVSGNGTVVTEVSEVKDEFEDLGKNVEFDSEARR
ncbi:hypothetical protein HDV05_005466 [Chytridiales sp. JEL 0842]|nr:hypothetical protein HDV05_005466 [Chytridiales sp. JEL 0842]